MSATFLLSEIVQSQATRYTYVAAEFLQVWDILLTLADEVRYLWPSRWNVVKFLFFVNRYCPPILFAFDIWYLSATDLSPSLSLWVGPTVLGIVVFATIEYTLVLRIYALYRSKLILHLLASLCLVSAATMATATLYWFFSEFKWYSPHSLLVPGCVAQCIGSSCKSLLVLFWVPLFVFEIAVLLFIVFDTWRNRATMHSDGRVRLASVIYRDGIIYYLFMIGISTFNLFIGIFAPPPLYYLGSSLMRSLQSVICSRLTLNIRETVDSGKKFGPSRNLDSLSFAGGQYSSNLRSLSETQTYVQFRDLSLG